MKVIITLIVFISIASKAVCQTITSISPANGSAYFSVIIKGTGLSGATNVNFNGINAICFYAYPNGDSMVALAPPGISTGPISVTTPGGTALSGVFNVVAGADPSVDFASIDTKPQSYASDWCNTNGGTWGPYARTDFAIPTAPFGVNAGDWARARIMAAALKWRYLPYQHHHIPDFDATLCPLFPMEKQVGPGLDCSNYTAFVYRYTFNHSMSSNVVNQAFNSSTGTLLSSGEKLLPGDLLFIKGSPTGTSVTHVAIYIDPIHRIDETSGLCNIRGWSNLTGWPYNSWESTRRPLDLINFTAQIPEPTNYPTNFSAHNIHLQWVDADGAVLPEGYLIRMSNSGFYAITMPEDGVPVMNTATDQNVLYEMQEAWFTNLNPNTTYYFKLYGYTGTGSLINYKTDGVIPEIQMSTSQ